MVRWRLGGKGWHNGSTMAMDSTGRREGDSEGLRVQPQWKAIDGNLTVMDRTSWRQWMTRQRCDGERQCDGDSTARDEEEWCEHNGDGDTAGFGSNKSQHGIKIWIKLNNYFIYCYLLNATRSEGGWRMMQQERAVTMMASNKIKG